jgi:hypothetical protein
MTVIAVAVTAAKPTSSGIKAPSIPIDVRVAKTPPAGVKPPYAKDWKAAARVPMAEGSETRPKGAEHDDIGSELYLHQCQQG